MEWRDVWRGLFPRKMIGSDVRDELSFHIDQKVRELVAEGWHESDARARVLEGFGDLDEVEAACRSYDTQRVDGVTWRMTMEAWVRDARFAVRSMRRNVGFTAVVVVTLALGIGATTSVFSVVEGVLLRPLPFADPATLVVLWENDRATGTTREDASTADYYDLVERARALDGIAMHGLTTVVLSRPASGPLQLNAALVSQNLVDVLGIRLQLGRNFSESEDLPDGPTAVILTDRLWRGEYGGDPQILSRVLTIDERPFEVIGVLPPDIDYPAGKTDIWTAIQQSPAIATRPNHWVRVLARLAPGSTVATAQADMTRIMSELEVEFASDNLNRGAFVERLTDVGRADVRLTLWVLFGAVLAVLAIACVNVANLLLARGAARVRELAVLAAVGAGAAQITRRFLVEGLIITAIAAVGGITLAALGVGVLTSLAPAELLLLGEPSVNRPVLLFVLGVSVVIGLGFGLLPAIQSRGLRLQEHLKDGRTTNGGSAGLMLRRLLVAGQLSLAVVLLLGATLLIGTLRNLQSVDPGFEAGNRLRVDFTLPSGRYPTDFATYPNWPEIHEFNRALLVEAGRVPGVRSVAVVLNHPLDAGFTNSFRIEGRAYDSNQGEMTTRLVTPGYFETAGVELRAGRLITEGDGLDTPPVVLLNEVAAARYFPAGDAIGSRLAFWTPTYREVVGIVENERIHGLTAAVPPAMYVSMFQSPPVGGTMTLLARTEVPPLSVVEGVRAAMRNVDSEVPVFNIDTMEETLADAMSRERFASTVFTIFAAVAALLAVLGVHGVLAYLVAQRGHEVGVRMALGATRRDVVQMVVRQGASMALLGVVGGLAVALAMSNVIQGLLYGVSATTPLVYAGVGLALGLVAMAATALPALRAASIDPVTSLRGD